MNIFNTDEFEALKEKYNKKAYLKKTTLEFKREGFFRTMKKKIQVDRRGEIVFIVERSNKKIITVTCTEYPPETYRIPTGGIGYDENIEEALFREIKEELGLEIGIVDFIGVYEINFKFKEDSEFFYSYLFYVKEIGGNLLVDATDDEISEIIEADVNTLEKTSENLFYLLGLWENWGKFRHLTTYAAYEYVKNMQ